MSAARKTALAALAVGALSLGFANVAVAAPGDPDPGFGTNGTTYLVSQAYDVAVYPDGSTAVGGLGYVARLLPNGKLDRSFGRKGYVDEPFDVDDGEADAIAIQPDGRIVVAGTSSRPSSSRYKVSLSRYLPDGTPDTSFSLDGVVKLRGPNTYKYPSATDVVIQPDGTIVTVGFFRNRNFIARLTAAGVPDSSFSGDGYFYLRSGFSGSGVQSIAPGPDGSVYGAGTVYNDAKLKTSDQLVVRVNSSGTLDPQFDSDGIATLDLTKSDRASDLVVQADGNIVVGGSASTASTDTQAALARFTATGAVDPSFSQDGKATLDVGTFGQNGINALGLGLDGRIYAAGGYAAVLGVLPTGEIDSSFGTGGVAEVPPAGTFEDAVALAIAPDGKVVVTGAGLDDSLEHRLDAVARIQTG